MPVPVGERLSGLEGVVSWVSEKTRDGGIRPPSARCAGHGPVRVSTTPPMGTVPDLPGPYGGCTRREDGALDRCANPSGRG